MTAATGDAISVSLTADAIPSFIHVSDGGVVFDSSTNKPVSTLVVKAGSAANYTLNFGADVSLTNLKAFGASTSTGITLDATTRITKNLNFKGSGGDDAITIPNGVHVGGNLTLGSAMEAIRSISKAE